MGGVTGQGQGPIQASHPYPVGRLGQWRAVGSAGTWAPSRPAEEGMP